jgi:hypothetical protein
MDPERLALCPEFPDPVLSLVDPSNIPGTFTKLLPAERMSTCPALMKSLVLSRLVETLALRVDCVDSCNKIVTVSPTRLALASPNQAVRLDIKREPLGALSTGSAEGGTGLKSGSKSWGVLAHPPTTSVIIATTLGRRMISPYQRFWFRKRSMPSAEEIAFEFTS